MNLGARPTFAPEIQSPARPTRRHSWGSHFGSLGPPRAPKPRPSHRLSVQALEPRAQHGVRRGACPAEHHWRFGAPGRASAARAQPHPRRSKRTRRPPEQASPTNQGRVAWAVADPRVGARAPDWEILLTQGDCIETTERVAVNCCAVLYDALTYFTWQPSCARFFGGNSARADGDSDHA